MLKLKISILPILRSKKKHASALPLKMLTGHLHFFLRILTNRFASLYLNRKLSPNSGIRKFNELVANKGKEEQRIKKYKKSAQLTQMGG